MIIIYAFHKTTDTIDSYLKINCSVLNDEWQGSSKITLQRFRDFLSLACTSLGASNFVEKLLSHRYLKSAVIT